MKLKKYRFTEIENTSVYYMHSFIFTFILLFSKASHRTRIDVGPHLSKRGQFIFCGIAKTDAHPVHSPQLGRAHRKINLLPATLCNHSFDTCAGPTIFPLYEKFILLYPVLNNILFDTLRFSWLSGHIKIVRRNRFALQISFRNKLYLLK